MNDCALQNIIRDAIIPVDIGLPIDGDTLVVRQDLRPELSKVVECPIVPVEPPPEDCADIGVDICFAGVRLFPSDRNPQLIVAIVPPHLSICP